MTNHKPDVNALAGLIVADVKKLIAEGFAPETVFTAVVRRLTAVLSEQEGEIERLQKEAFIAGAASEGEDCDSDTQMGPCGKHLQGDWVEGNISIIAGTGAPAKAGPPSWAPEYPQTYTIGEVGNTEAEQSARSPQVPSSLNLGYCRSCKQQAEAVAQARLEEAKWWQVRTPPTKHGELEVCRCEKCKRIAELERAVKEAGR